MSTMVHPNAAPRTPAEQPSSRPWRFGGHLLAVVLALGCVAGLIATGVATGWKLTRAADTAKDDWCIEHGVPDSECVECHPGLLPRDLPQENRGRDWCEKHGVHQCPLCNPSMSQLRPLPTVTDADRARAARSLAFTPRAENESKCTKHLRLVQLASEEVATRLGLGFAQAALGPVHEVVHAPGEITYDLTRVSRVASRAPGSIWRVEKQVGDKVRAGEVLALVDAAEVGKAKAEFQHALVQYELRRETLDRLHQGAGSTVPGKSVQVAEAALEEAEVRTLAAEDRLATLGMPIRVEDVRKLLSEALAPHMQLLGIPDRLAADLGGLTASSNLLPVTAALDGEIVERSAVKDEVTDPSRPLFVVADTSRMRLTLRVRPEDADRVKPGLPVRFRHPGHSGPVGWDAGKVVWVSSTADETSRTVPVRVDLLNPSDQHHSNTFGMAEVLLREETDAILVPSNAVHWEGCCHIVFVRDHDYEKPGTPKVFHVRTVRPGARVETPRGPMTEIAVGLLPGEVVATSNSGSLRSELLKNNLGEGCACCAGKK